MAETFNPDRRNRMSRILKKRFLHVVIICLLGLIVYSNTFHVPFQWDEGHFIRDNPVVKDFSYFVHPSHAPAQFYSALVGRYIGYLTFALNYEIGGLNVAGYHVFNLAIHIFSALLVYLLVVLTFKTPHFRKHSAKSIEHRATDKGQTTARIGHGATVNELVMARGGESEAQETQVSEPSALCPMPDATLDSRSANFIALFAALLFVSHPVQTEAVTYVFQRLASLAAMFYLLSIVFYIKGRLGAIGNRKREKTEGAGGNGQEAVGGEKRLPIAHRLLPVAYYVLSLLFAVLAMKTKENAFTLPIVIALYEFLFFEGSKKIRALFLIPMSLTLLIIPVTLVLTSGVTTNPFDPSSMVFRHIPRWDYFVTQARVLVTYVRLFFLPFNQDVDYDYPVFHSLLDPSVLLSALFLLSLFGIGVYLLYRSRGHSAESTAQKADLPPRTSSLKPAAPYFRLISFGIFWFFITLSVESSLQPIPEVIDEYRMYLPLAGMALAAVAGMFLLCGKFKGRGKGVAVILLPVFFIVLFSVATYARNSVWETKISLWRDAAAKSPRKAGVHINLGAAYDVAGELDKAISQYKSALHLDPFFKQSYIDLCIAYSEKNLPYAAVHYCRTAVSLYPGSARAHYELGRMYLEEGLADDARGEVEIALQINPGFYDAKELLYEIEMAETGHSPRQ
jgi:protein O-mannosyl-transferase